MIKVMFLCHGNICRSVMAEFMFKSMINELGIGDDFIIDSKAVSSEEIGNDIYPAAKRCLDRHNILYTKRKASKFTKDDYEKYDYIFVMDYSNIYNLKYIVEDKENKVSLLLKDRQIADPWYSGDFEKTYNDIEEGLKLFIDDLHLI